MTVHIVEDPADTLGLADIGPTRTDAYRDAEDHAHDGNYEHLADWLEAMDDEQQLLADAYGRAFEVAAEHIADERGVEIDVLVTGDASDADEHMRRNGPRDRDDGPDEIDRIWQHTHERIAVEWGESGWRVATDGWEESRGPLDLVGVAEVARLAGLSERSVRTYVRRGTIVHPVPVAGSDALVWRRADVLDWLDHRPGRGRPT